MQAPDVLRRIWAAPRGLSPDQQLAGLAAIGLLVSMLLPWYEKSSLDSKGARFVNDSISAFGTVSFVEAAVFLVAAGVLVLLFTRAERREFELPGGDGTVIFGAGLWAAALLFYRVFDKPNVAGEATTVGIQWGFFVAFVAAASLAAAGWRMRQHARGRASHPPARSRPQRAGPDVAPPPPSEPEDERTERVGHDTPDRLF